MFFNIFIYTMFLAQALHYINFFAKISYVQDSAYNLLDLCIIDLLKRDIATANRAYVTRASMCGAIMLITYDLRCFI